MLRSLVWACLRTPCALSALASPPSWWTAADSVPGSFCRAMLGTLGAVDSGGLKRKMAKKVATHNGTFHCDEALGCFMIRLTDKFADAEIVRTRDQKVRHARFGCWILGFVSRFFGNPNFQSVHLEDIVLLLSAFSRSWILNFLHILHWRSD